MEGNEHPSHDSAAAADLERKHSAMLERLSNRHHSRLSAKSDPNLTNAFESTQSFLSQFSQSKSTIESELTGIRQHFYPTRKSDLEAISLQISALEKLVAENSYYLPPYEVRNCISIIAHLRQSLDDVTSIVIPKKKFSFKNRPSKKTTLIIPPHEDEVLYDEPDKKLNLETEKLGFRDLNPAYGFTNRENEVLLKEFNGNDSSEVQNGEFTLSDLRALFMDKLINCKVYVGAVMGSVLIEGVGCVFVLGAYQIRIHNAKSCDFYLRVRSRPIIEDCIGVRFAPYCLSYDGIEKDLREANLGEENGNWENVEDFRWLRALQSPNWSVLMENERMDMVDISNVENVN